MKVCIPLLALLVNCRTFVHSFPPDPDTDPVNDAATQMPAPEPVQGTPATPAADPTADAPAVVEDPPPPPVPTGSVVPAPAIVSFTASSPITLGNTTSLVWSTTGATAVQIDGVTVTGTSKTYAPGSNHTYVLTATNSAGVSVTASASVTVNAPSSNGKVVFASGAYANGWAYASDWFDTYDILGSDLHLHGGAAYQGFLVGTTTALARASYPYINLTLQGSGTLSLEVDTTGDGDSDTSTQIILPATSQVVSIPTSSLWGASISAFQLKNATSNMDVLISKIEFGPKPTVVCGNPQPSAPLSVSYASPTTFKAGADTHWVAVHEGYDTACHSVPSKLYVWLHGCGGKGEGDIWNVRAASSADNWVAIALGTREGLCWNGATADATITAAITAIKSQLNIDPKQVIIGGYSSGGDVGYPYAFAHSASIALALFENTAPCETNASCTARIAQATHRFAVRHLCHTEDDTDQTADAPGGSYSCTWLSGVIGVGGKMPTAGHDAKLYQRAGTHYWGPPMHTDVLPEGTWAGWNADLRPELRKTWLSP